MFKHIALATALLTTLGAGVAFAESPRSMPAPERTFAPPRASWQSLGEVRIKGGRRASRSAVLVPARGTGPVAKLRLVARGHALAAAKVTVTFGNGETFSAFVDANNALIDLPGTARHIRSIEIAAAGRARFGAADIQVLGQQLAMMPRPDHDHRRF